MYPKLSAFDLTDNDANNCYIIQIWDLADTERKGFLSKQVKKKHDRVYLLSEELGLYSADFFFFFYSFLLLAIFRSTAVDSLCSKWIGGGAKEP